MTKRLKTIGCLLALALLPACFLTGAAAEVFLGEPPTEWEKSALLKWTIFDVDEGDAMLLECGGESMLVDGGPNPFREKLRDALDARGLRHGLKYILTTHSHDDHIDGIIRLFEYGFTAGEYLHPYNDWAIRDSERMTRTIKAATRNNVPNRRVVDGDTLTLGEASIRVFQCTTIKGTNARSLMLKVSFQDSSILLCADIIGRTQQYFLENLPEGTLDADLIKLPHHAITPTVPAFLDAVSPVAAIATNVEKEIDPKSINQLKGRPFPAFFSGNGTVYAVTNGTDWYIYQTVGTF